MKKKINRQKIIDDLCQYDVYMIMKNINREDYDWLSSIREYGFKGYTNYTDKELIMEWEDSEDGYKCIECEIETIKECYLECEDCGEYTCEGNGECIDCGSEKLKEILEVNV